jgi:hypothetical protein
MLPDKLKEWLISQRAWEIYAFLQKLPEPQGDLVYNLYEQIYLATFSGALRLHLHWPSLNKKLSIRETYTFLQNQLRIKSYSYALIETGDRVIIRADSAPHHERDYQRKLLTKFPHHLHDERGRICSFNGNIEDFIKLAVPYFV